MMSLVVAAVVVVVAMVAMVATLTPPSDHFFQLLVGQFAASRAVLCQTSLLFTAEAVAIQHILPSACKIEFHWLFPFFDSTHL
jgi:hypothetical protein